MIRERKNFQELRRVYKLILKDGIEVQEQHTDGTNVWLQYEREISCSRLNVKLDWDWETDSYYDRCLNE